MPSRRWERPQKISQKIFLTLETRKHYYLKQWLSGLQDGTNYTEANSGQTRAYGANNSRYGEHSAIGNINKTPGLGLTVRAASDYDAKYATYLKAVQR